MATDPEAPDTVTTDDAIPPVSAPAPAAPATTASEAGTTGGDDDTSTTPPPAPPSAQAFAGMVADPAIPGSLMQGAQKEMLGINAMAAQLRGSQKRAQAVVNKVLDNEGQAILAQGEDGITPGLDASKLSQLYAPEQVKIILDKRNAYMLGHNASADWDPNTPYSKLMADVEQANPHNVPADSPAFQTYVQVYNNLMKQALGMEKRRQFGYKATAEESARTADQMMQPDNVRAPGVPAMTADWARDNQKNMDGATRDKVTKYINGGADYSNAAARDDLMEKSLYMTPEDFRQEVITAHSNRLISNADEDHALTQNKEAQDDVGVKYLSGAMDTHLLGKDDMMVNELNSLKQKVIQMYRAERSAHPTWKDSDRLDLAMRLERDNQIFSGATMQLSLPITGFMKQAGATDRNSVNEDIIAKAKEIGIQENAAGRMNGYQKMIEYNNQQAWTNYFNTLKANGKSMKDKVQNVIKRQPQ